MQRNSNTLDIPLPKPDAQKVGEMFVTNQVAVKNVS